LQCNREVDRRRRDSVSGRRRIAFRAWAAILAGVFGVALFGLTSLALAWFQEVEGVAGPVTDLGYGVLIGIILTTGLLVQLRRPERKIAGVQQAFLVIPALVIGSAVASDSQDLVPALILLPAIGILLALHPARGEFLRRGARPSRTLLAITVIGAVPLVAYALDMGAQAQDLAGPPHHVQRLSTMAAMAVAIVLTGLLAALRTQGWRIPAWSASMAAIVFGLASVVFPDQPAAVGRGWGGVAIAGGVLFIAVSEWPVRRATPALVLLGALALISGCGGGSSSTPPPVERVAQELARGGAASVIVFVSDDGREFVATAGTRRPNADERFRIGSVTKTFTAAIVLQLAAEERLRLGDTLERYLPGVVPQGDKITIRRLLNHRSGLPNVTDYERWLDQASRSPSTRPIDVLRFAASHPSTFPPGSRWGYSNTNYIALGLVIEEATGHTYRQELEQRILEPLELDSTELPKTRRLPDLDDEGENPNVPWAAGALVSNARDLARFFSALLSGRILSEDSLAEMKQTVAVDQGPFRDGLGIFSTELPCGRFWGHDGGILDYGTIVKASEDGNRIAIISGHGGAPSGPPPDETALLCPSDATTSSRANPHKVAMTSNPDNGAGFSI
jgi:D-alanyl-D-alanine carboxypeptidase